MFRRKEEMLRKLDQDIRDYIERETLDNIERGMPPEEARFAAIRKFGNVQLVREQTREVWVAAALEQLAQDIRYGLRTLRHNPLFAIVTILTLGVGIGVNTAVFSVIDTVLLRPLPYPDANRIVIFSDRTEAGSGEHFKPDIAGADFAEWRTHSTSFEKLAGYTYNDQTVAAGALAEQVRVVSTAGDFWAITGARPFLGTLLHPDSSRHSVVLSYSLFKRQFKADPSVIGRTISLDGESMTVTAILPQHFRFFFPQNWWSFLAPSNAEAFISAPPLLRSTPSRLFVVGRLKTNSSIPRALTELKSIQTNILKSNPDRWFPGVSRMALAPLNAQLVGGNRQALLILQIAGLFVLLIACANIANLLLARGAARVHEMAIRTAIGAGAMRILRQFLTEGVLLSTLGGAAGLLIAKAILLLLIYFGPNAVPRLPESSIDARVLAFTLGLCLGSGILFGCGPATALWRQDIQNALKEGSRNSSANAGGLRIRRFLVAAELALAIVLLTGAGLMVKSFWKMYANPSGFAPENTLVMKVALSGPRYVTKEKQLTYLNELLSRLESAPGIQAFGIANTQDYLLQSANSAVAPVVDGFRESLVSPDYLHAIGMRLLQGRWFTDTDSSDAALINQTMARRFFGGKDPLGKRIDRLGRPVRVVGVVANLKYAKLDADPGPELFRAYSPNLEGGNLTVTVALRLRGDPLGLAPALRNSLAGIDPAQPVYDVESLEQALASSVAARRFQLLLFGLFAAAALVMAVVGVYGVIAYSVAQRTREIGIRIALGAQRGKVVQMIVAQGLIIGFWGIAAGLAAAFGMTRLMAKLLYAVSPSDPAIFSAVAAALAGVVVLAAWIPGCKASRVDPLAALRAE